MWIFKKLAVHESIKTGFHLSHSKPYVLLRIACIFIHTVAIGTARIIKNIFPLDICSLVKNIFWFATCDTLKSSFSNLLRRKYRAILEIGEGPKLMSS